MDTEKLLGGAVYGARVKRIQPLISSNPIVRLTQIVSEPGTQSIPCIHSSLNLHLEYTVRFVHLIIGW